MNKRGLPLRIVESIWLNLDRLRRLLHLILLLGLLLFVLAALIGERVQVPGVAALRIAPRGNVVDQLSGDPLDRALARARGQPVAETLLKDVIDAIRAARDDDRIKALVLDPGGMGSAGLSKLEELAKEIAEFKKSGKPVVAIGDSFTRDQYFLAAQADKVYLNPMGEVLIDGYSRYLPYYKSLLDKLYVDYNFWTVGEYKSFVEPATRDDMSPPDREASLAFLKALWNSYQANVTAARHLPAQALQQYADRFDELVADAHGDTAKTALDYGLVDELLPRDAMRERIRELTGEPVTEDRQKDDYTAIDFQDYVEAMRRSHPPPSRRDKIAVIVASGTILDGKQPPGSIGGDSLTELIRHARADKDVKALVLRVDSGGGSAFASDVILRELEVFQQTKRPLVVSMGSVAASGGYWISMSADEIWASPATLTGSIGVGATAPTFQNTLEHLGVHIDGVGTTKLSGATDVLRGLGDNYKASIKESIHNLYGEFIGKVAQHRKRSVEEIDQAARGRVWAGMDALDRGLVDRLGNLDDAIESAAGLAGLESGRYEIEYIEPQAGLAERLVMQLTSAAAPAVRALTGGPRLPANVSKWVESAMQPLEFAARLNDPRGIYMYCFCDTR
jgi:protease IV